MNQQPPSGQPLPAQPQWSSQVVPHFGQSQQPQYGTQKWEYLTISIDAKGLYDKKLNEKASMEQLNRLGQDGWELISTIPISRTGRWTRQEATYAFAFIFKRLKL